MPDTHGLALEMAEVRSDIKAVRLLLDDMRAGLVGVGDLREDLAKYQIHHEQFRQETKKVWERIDAHRDEIKALNATIENWKGRLQMAATVTTLLSAVGGSIVGWSWMRVQEIPLLEQRIQVLEKATK